MNIAEFIKQEMAARGMTYDVLATKAGTSRQNLWIKINKSVKPNFETMKRVLEALDYEVGIEKRADAPEAGEAEIRKFFECTEEEQISYECVEKLAAAMGYEITIKTHKNEIFV